MQSVLEVATPVCHTPAGVRQQLLRIRALRLRRRAGEGPARRLGGHASVLALRAPADHGEGPLPRARRPDAVHRATRAHLRDARPRRRRRPGEGDPGRRTGSSRTSHELVALSASSPFWRGEPTGLRSSRHMVFAAFPRSGPPPRFRDYSDYAQVVNQLEKTGCIQDYTHIWWDIRLHPRLGTIEIRICDAVTQLDDVIAITAYCQALVKHYAELVDRGEEIPSFHRILTTENKWLAARYGLSAPVMDLHTGKRNRLPVAALDPPHAEDARPARARARLGGGARRDRGDPPPRQRRRPPAPRLQREPGHRRGRARDRRGDRGRRPGDRAVVDRPDARDRETRLRSTPSSGRRRARRASIGDLLHDRPVLLLFYLFDWSTT